MLTPDPFRGKLRSYLVDRIVTIIEHYRTKHCRVAAPSNLPISMLCGKQISAPMQLQPTLHNELGLMPAQPGFKPLVGRARQSIWVLLSVEAVVSLIREGDVSRDSGDGDRVEGMQGMT